MRAVSITAAFIMLSSGYAAHAAETPSAADKAFIAKVSQGGMFEVQLGQLAAAKAARRIIRDQGNTEAHDHQLVGDKTKSNCLR